MGSGRRRWPEAVWGPMSALVVPSKSPEEVIDITDEVATRGAAAGDDTCGLFLRHTTCAHTC
jgi:hypothetical protein